MVVGVLPGVREPDELTLESVITNIIHNLPDTFSLFGSDQEAVAINYEHIGHIDYPEDMESRVESISIKTFSDAFLVGKEYLLHAYTLHFRSTGELYQADAKIVRCMAESETGRKIKNQIIGRMANIKMSSHSVELPHLRYYVFAKRDNASPINIVGEVSVRMPEQCTLLNELRLWDSHSITGDLVDEVVIGDLDKENSWIKLRVRFNPEESDLRYFGAGGRWTVYYDWQGGTNLAPGEYPLRLLQALTPCVGDAKNVCYIYKRISDGIFEVLRNDFVALKPRSLAELNIPPISGPKVTLTIYDPERK